MTTRTRSRPVPPLRPPHRRGALALVAWLPLACATGAGEPSSSVAGCYQFRWDEGARTLGLPWGVVLEDRPLGEGWATGEGAELFAAETATSPTGRADHPFAYWRRTAADSIEVGHPGGGGITLTLAPEGQDLVGRGRPTGDVVRPGEGFGPRPGAPVVAHRVVCGAS